MSRIVIIGGGAAGMMAAGFAAQYGHQVTVLEKSKTTCLKLGITGKGRCNVTNNCDTRTLIENIPQNGKFLYGAFKRFSPQDVMDFFESIGVPLKTERGARVFPASDKALDVVYALRGFAKENGVHVVQKRADKLLLKDGAIAGVIAAGERFDCDRVLLATGGLSYPKTGSDGDGYRMAKEVGHHIIAQRPSLVPLNAEDTCGKMQGLALKNVKLTVLEDGNPIYEDFGEMLFTHFGVSGPLILSASAHMRKFDRCKYRLLIDLKPALDEKQLDARILRDFSENLNRDFGNSLSGLLPKLMIPRVIERCGIAPWTKVHSVTKEQRKCLCDTIKAFSVEVFSMRGIEEAIITSGGVDTKEVDPKTMESKLVNGLFFAGEILDVDAYTGGFNLQIAWSTARTAAESF